MPNDLRRHVLLDTNVLVAAVDPRELDRAHSAIAVVRSLVSADRAAVTPPIIAEYYDVTTRPKGPLRPVFSRAEAAESVEEILSACECVDLTLATLMEAVRGAIAHQMRIYDAHVWAAAKVNSIPYVVTEDTPSRPVVEGVRYVDPFTEAFDLAHIGL